MPDEINLVKISDLPAATSPGEYDVLAGVQTGDTKQFSFGTVLQWIKNILHPSDIGAVPVERTVNNKSLIQNITLTASDVGAVDTDDVGIAGGVASLDGSGKVPSSQLDLSGKQDEITASGILKGDGAGGVSAAAAGTDYQAPLTFDTTPTEDSNNPVTSDGINAAIKARYSTNTIFNTLTDVHSDTTITMDHSFTNYKFLMIVFNTRSPASGSYRIPLVVSTNALPQGGYYPIANPDSQGYVRLNYVSGQAKQLRVQNTNFPALYISSVVGLT